MATCQAHTAHAAAPLCQLGLLLAGHRRVLHREGVARPFPVGNLRLHLDSRLSSKVWRPGATVPSGLWAWISWPGFMPGGITTFSNTMALELHLRHTLPFTGSVHHLRGLRPTPERRAPTFSSVRHSYRYLPPRVGTRLGRSPLEDDSCS